MSQQLLLFAEPLLREGLARLLREPPHHYRVATAPTDLEGPPQLVLWHPETSIEPSSLWREAHQLSDHWQPAPLLIVLPGGVRLSRDQLLALPAAGLIENPDHLALLEAITTLLAGGRVVDLQGTVSAAPSPPASPTLGMGQLLLISGLQQIDRDLQACRALLEDASSQLLLVLVLEGRLRELNSARTLLLWLWGPVSLAWGELPEPSATTLSTLDTAANRSSPGGADRGGGPDRSGGADRARPPTQITLARRTAEGTWTAIQQRLRERIETGLVNRSGQLMAMEGLHRERRSDLLLALLDQLELLRLRLGADQPLPAELRHHWLALQPELREQALRRMASPYVRLPQEGQLRPVAETLLRNSNLSISDPELPDPHPMLAALVLGQPLLVDGQLLAPDEPLAVLQLERLVCNWLLRNAEQVSAQVLGSCAAWPELRRYLLVPDLLATRNLERLRNQLNAQQRWNDWFERPVALYESRRLLLELQQGAILLAPCTEPRDQELRQLSFGQQLVTLALETRDAVAPQLQSLIKGLGNVLVVVLTQVLGRAIGLIGRGILQGMGRSVSRS